MTEKAINGVPETADPGGDRRAWIDPEISEPKDLIGYPDGIILQGGSGTEP